MLFEIRKASDYEYKEVKEINTLEELIEFFKENGDLILRDTLISENPDTQDMTIEIYDDWRE